MKPNYRALELKLRTIVEKRLEEGWNVKPHLISWSTGTGACCAIGAVSPDKGIYPGVEAYVDELGISKEIAFAISDGFEGHDFERSMYMPDAREIGARIRRDYCEWTDEASS